MTKKTYTIQQFRKDFAKKKPKKQKTYTSKQFQNKFAGRSEDAEQAAFCKWIKIKYPKVLYTVDLAGMNLSPAQQRIHQTRCKRGHPDITFDEWYKDIYCGLAIEFKKTNVKINDYTVQKDPHLKEQLRYLQELRARGRLAIFVCGLENAKIVLKQYLEAGPMSLKIIQDHSYPNFL